MGATAHRGLEALIAAVRAGSIGGEIGQARATSDASGRGWTYAMLVAEAARICERLRAHRPAGVLLLLADQSAESVAALLGGLAAGYQVILQGTAMDDARLCIEQAFRPDAIFERGGLQLAAHAAPLAYPAAAVLLSTSGTTGSSKFVRLPLAALVANARQIAGALRIASSDVALGHLPIHYSYGLSVVTSHLEVGAAVHLTALSFTQPAFWRDVAAARATHLPGVPFHYMFLARGALGSLVPPCITSFTQAGGALAVPIRQRIHDAVGSRGGRFYVMYGQTETAPRITTLDHADFPAHPESVGRVMAGGHLRIVNEQGGNVAPGEEGEIVYSGPNVMAGYACTREDLTASDLPLPSIRTGDRGVLDERGFLTLRGRDHGFAKVGGLRLSLDDMAARLAPFSEVALLPGDDKVHVFHAAAAEGDLKPHIRNLALDYAIPVGSFSLHLLADIPRHASGKVDYQRLREMAE